MNTVPAARPAVKPTRQPFRPLLAPPAVAHWTDECHAVHVLLSGKRATDSYELVPLSTEIGGAAFRWFKQGGECHDVLVCGADSSAPAPASAIRRGANTSRRRLSWPEVGVLTPAPASAAGECDDDAA